jgi:hypothetical protein
MEDNRMSLMDEERSGRGKITGLDVTKSAVVEFVDARRAWKGWNLKDKRSTTTRGTASGGNSHHRLIDGEIAAAHRHRRRSTRSETKSCVNNDSQDERTEDADRGALRVDSKQSQGAGWKGNDGNDGAHLGDGPNLDLENEFHRQRPQ